MRAHLVRKTSITVVPPASRKPRAIALALASLGVLAASLGCGGGDKKRNDGADTRGTTAGTGTSASPRSSAGVHPKNEAPPTSARASVSAAASTPSADGSTAREPPPDLTGSASAPATATLEEHARVELVVQMDPYDVSGSTIPAIRASIDSARPTQPNGERYDAYTTWHLDWHYPFDAKDGSCATGPVRVTVTVKYQLPEYDPPDDAAPEVRSAWEAYARALRSHEDGHRDMGVRAAEEIQRTLEALPPEPNCPAMDAVANERAHAIRKRYSTDESHYDVETHHGATQGARFPCRPAGAGCQP